MKIDVVEAPPQAVEAEVLAFAVVEPARLAGPAAELDRLLSGRLAHLIEDREVKGSGGHVALVHTLGQLAARRVAAAGVGKEAALEPDALRTAAARVAARVGALRGGTIGWLLDPALPIAPEEQARAIVEGTVLGTYDPGHWKTAQPEAAAIDRLVLCGEGAGGIEPTARRAGIAADWTNRCRRLVDGPANEVTPAALADEAASVAQELPHLRLQTLGTEEIARAGMGALAAVAKGSEVEPRLIALDYEPPQAPSEPVLGLVGKAITFDSGGLSIKPAARMDEMKGDMAGGAAVLCGLAAVAALELPLRARAVIASCENMPSGSAFRPGDILKALNGKTIEVTNTDAEGRLVLADALVYARQRGATHMLDLATLTGAVVVALGDFYAGLLGNDDDFVTEIRAAAERSGDHAWPLPLHETYKRYLRTPFADLKNSSDLRQAGPIYAASFLQEFAGDGPWAHLDIAGTAHLARSRGDYYTHKGGTGYGVRLIAALAERLAASEDRG
jgi:leucyl aminopeptidase